MRQAIRAPAGRGRRELGAERKRANTRARSETTADSISIESEPPNYSPPYYSLSLSLVRSTPCRALAEENPTCPPLASCFIPRYKRDARALTAKTIVFPSVSLIPTFFLPLLFSSLAADRASAFFLLLPAPY